LSGGNHKRIPSYIKSIPLSKLSVSPNTQEFNRKKAYETIVNKITSSG
jgi:hypothetical protein